MNDWIWGIIGIILFVFGVVTGHLGSYNLGYQQGIKDVMYDIVSVVQEEYIIDAEGDFIFGLED